MENRGSEVSQIAELSKSLGEVHRAIGACDSALRNTTPQGTPYRGPATFAIQYEHAWKDEHRTTTQHTRHDFGMTMEEAREWIVQMVTAQREELLRKYRECMRKIHEASGDAGEEEAL